MTPPFDWEPVISSPIIPNTRCKSHRHQCDVLIFAWDDWEGDHLFAVNWVESLSVSCMLNVLVQQACLM